MLRRAQLAVAVTLGWALTACDGTPVVAPTGSPLPGSPQASAPPGSPPSGSPLPGSPQASAPPGSPASALPGEFPAPPLRLPRLAPGDACPVAEPQPWANPGQASRVLGPGPLYPVADYLPGNALPLREGHRNPDGSYTVKLRWLSAGYTGSVLVRAGRIDGPGAASVEFSYLGEPRDGGHHAVLTRPDTDLPATTTVTGPGCYAFQVDGTSFTYTIIFRATPTPT